MPVLRLTDSSRRTKSKEAEEGKMVALDITTTTTTTTKWEETTTTTLFDLLPLGVVGDIGKHLGVGHDYMNFRLVCRTWSLAAPPFRWRRDLTSSVTMPYPWLLTFDFLEKETSCKFYDPGQFVTYHKKAAPELSVDCTVIRFSKDGWLLFSQGKCLFLLELFTLEIIKLPDLLRNNITGLCFSSSPGSSDFLVVGIAQEDPETSLVFYLCTATNSWKGFEKTFVPSRSHPVYLNGIFYFLGQDGSLGAFTYIPGHKGKWTVLNRRHKTELPTADCRCFLVSKDENPLLSVFVGNSGEWIRVFRFGTLKKKWLRLNHLRDCALFVSETKSLVVRAEENVAAMKNKIYFPHFNTTNHGRKMLSYSMEDRRFEADADTDLSYAGKSFFGTKEDLNSTWFRCSLLPQF